MTGTCPSCGVAVISGYVKCPRCHAVLPGSSRIPRSNLDPGGTSIPERPFPLMPVIAGAIAIALVLFFVLDGKKPPPRAAEAADVSGANASASVVAAPASAAPTPQPVPRPLDIPGAAGPTAAAAAAELERALGRQRLWSSVQPSGDHVDVRSGSCADPAIGPVIDAARTALRGAGLTRLRCLAQSGAVVFERDL